MENAKRELLDEVDGKEVEYVKIAVRTIDRTKIYAEGTLEEVLPLLDVEYDEEYGEQNLFGYIWYTDGTWVERSEYDGSEWSSYKKCPSKDLKVTI